MKVNVNGVEIFYRDEGAGLPILFVHGFPLDGALWYPQLVDLAHEYRVIVPDLRGFGYSASSPETTMERYADDVCALLDELEIDHVVLAGLSMGGYVVFAFYRKYPDRIRGLMLVDTRAQPDSDEARENRAATAERVKERGSSALADEMFGNLLAEATFEDKPNVVRITYTLMARQSQEGIVPALYAMAGRPDSRPLLGEISEPTLVVVGAEDTVTPVEDAEAMVDAIPGAKLVVIPEAGHLPNLEQPEAFNQAVRQFIATRIEVS